MSKCVLEETLRAIEGGESFDYLDNVIAPMIREELKRKPVAWCKKFGNDWHFITSGDPFPSDDWIPLYERKEK